MLRYLQKRIVRRRPLEVSDPTASLEGETSFISVNRHNTPKITFEELANVTDPRSPLRFEGKVLEQQRLPVTAKKLQSNVKCTLVSAF